MFTLNDLLHQLNKELMISDIKSHTTDQMYKCVNLYVGGAVQCNTLYICRSADDLTAFKNTENSCFIVSSKNCPELHNPEMFSCEWAICDTALSPEELLNTACSIVCDPGFSSRLDRIKRILSDDNEELSLSQLLHKLHPVFGNPIMLVDDAYNLLAVESGGRYVNEKVWNDIKTAGAFTPEIIRHNRESGITATATNQNKVLYFDKISYQKHPCIVTEIWSADGHLLGRLNVLGCFRPFINEDSECLLYVANYLSEYMAEKHIKPDYHEFKELLRELLNGRKYNNNELKTRLDAIGWGGYSYFQLCYMKYPNISHQASYILQKLRSVDPHVVGLKDNDQLYLLFCSDKIEIFPELLSRIEAVLQENELNCGVSSVFPSLRSLPTAAKNAEAVLRIGSTLSQQNLYQYRDYLIYLAVDHLEPAQLRQLSHSGSYYKMSLYDQSEGTPYATTMLTYIQSGCSMQAASEKLFIHKSTLVYRMEKIQKLFNIDFRSVDDLLDFYFSYKIHYYEVSISNKDK